MDVPGYWWHSSNYFIVWMYLQNILLELTANLSLHAVARCGAVAGGGTAKMIDGYQACNMCGYCYMLHVSPMLGPCIHN